MESELHMQLSSVVNNEIPPQMSSSYCQLGPQNETITGPTILSPFLGDPFRDPHHTDNNKTVSYDGLFNRGSSSDFHSLVPPLQQELPSSSLREMLPCNNPFSLSSFLMDPIQSLENQDMNQWVLPNSVNISSSSCLPYGIPLISHNELSLSLATCEPNVVNGGCCSDMSCSSVAHNSQLQTRPRSDRGSNSGGPPQFSHETVSGSEYLSALQQILSELAGFSLEGLDPSSGCGSNIPMSLNHGNSDHPTVSFKGASEVSGDDDESLDYAPAESSNNRRQEVDTKKSQLLGLLVSVDECYTRCLDEIHTVISAFHAATELDPQVHACFPLQTVSLVYKSLRERISNEILVTGMGNNGSHRRSDTMRSFEKAFIQKQWALQQLKRKDQQLWRPQRGLPERSVSVLRAWMFENFLHPYPKDAEKHLLAIKSGLTRSQVSNWFINARVRLWKPLVEEMCAELNRRKGARQNQNDNEATNENNSSQQSHLSMFDYSQRFNT